MATSSAASDEAFQASLARIAGVLKISLTPLDDPEKEKERKKTLKDVADKLRIAINAREKAEGSLDFSRK